VKKQSRYLHFDNIEAGQRISSECSLCKRPFFANYRPDERTDDVLIRIRAEFEAHDCHQSPNSSV